MSKRPKSRRLVAEQGQLTFDTPDQKPCAPGDGLSQNLDSLTFEEKRLLLDALEVKVLVYHGHNRVRGLLPPHVVPAHVYVTIARTSGYLPFYAYVYLEQDLG